MTRDNGTASGPPSRPPKAHDVAALAGVSVATVSLVINGKASGRVSISTQRRVEAVVKELGYRVNESGRSLATGTRHPLVAVITPDILNPFYSFVTHGIIEGLGASYQLLLVAGPMGSGVLQERIDTALLMGVDGIIIDAPTAQVVKTFEPACPMVLLDASGLKGSGAAVEFDLRSGSRALADHLKEQGYQRAAYLDAVTGSETFGVRRAALRDQLHAHGVEMPEGALLASEVDMEASARVFRGAYRRLESLKIDVIVCSTDLQAYGVLGAAQEMGLQIPEDLAVAAYDDLPYSKVVQPPLTSVSLPPYELGFVAASMLREGIETRAKPTARVVLPTRLRARASTLG